MSREQDELIAERLFGWKWMAFYGWPDGLCVRQCRVRHLFCPEMLTGDTWRQWQDAGAEPASGFEPLWCKSIPGRVPPYTSDASADHLVLEHVREHWTHEQTQAFVEELKTLRWPRCNVSQPFSLELFAEPGDYSLAALAVLIPRCAVICRQYPALDHLDHFCLLPENHSGPHDFSCGETEGK